MGKTQPKQTECHVQRYGWSKVVYIKISGHEAIGYARKTAKDQMIKYFLCPDKKYGFYPIVYRSGVSIFLTRGRTCADLCFRKKQKTRTAGRRMSYKETRLNAPLNKLLQ